MPGGAGHAALSGVGCVKKTATNLPASVRQRLLNLANERRQDFGMLLTNYALERFLYRLSVSQHHDSFVLKGALLLQLWTSEAYRPTRDLDLLGEGPAKGYRKTFAEVCGEKVEDAANVDSEQSIPARDAFLDLVVNEFSLSGLRSD